MRFELESSTAEPRKMILLFEQALVDGLVMASANRRQHHGLPLDRKSCCDSHPSLKTV